MSQGKFSIIFLSKYMTKNLVRMLLLLSHFSPFVLGLHIGWEFVQSPRLFYKNNQGIEASVALLLGNCFF
jgi:hypothetical protein